MDYSNFDDVSSSTDIWLSASLQAGEIVYLPKARPAPQQPGTLREQEWIAEVYGELPDHLAHEERYEWARRVVLHHARRAG